MMTRPGSSNRSSGPSSTMMQTPASPSASSTISTASHSSVSSSPLQEITSKLDNHGIEGKETLAMMHKNARKYMEVCFAHAKRRLIEEHFAEPSSSHPSTPTISTSVPATPTIQAPQPVLPPPSSANTTISPMKKQRRSVVQAAQVAQVKKKVAMYESMSTPPSTSQGSPVGGQARPIRTPVSKANAVAAGARSPLPVNVNKYTAVFPGLFDLGGGTLMGTRIKEEDDDEGGQQAPPIIEGVEIGSMEQQLETTMAVMEKTQVVGAGEGRGGGGVVVPMMLEAGGVDQVTTGMKKLEIGGGNIEGTKAVESKISPSSMVVACLPSEEQQQQQQQQQLFYINNNNENEGGDGGFMIPGSPAVNNVAAASATGGGGGGRDSVEVLCNFRSGILSNNSSKKNNSATLPLLSSASSGEVRVQPEGSSQGQQALAAATDEGPEPIIECNHKKPVLRVPTPNPTAMGGEFTTHNKGGLDHLYENSLSNSNNTSNNNSGILGMFQKKMGLGKHSARLSTHAPMMGSGGASAAASSTAVFHDALPPPNPEDSYQISESESDKDQDFSDSNDSDDNRPQKKIPAWAKGPALAEALEKQYNSGAADNCWVDPDTIFPEVSTCNLEEIFKVKKKRYYKRTSSGIWDQDGLTAIEKLTYKKAMEFDNKKKRGSQGC